MPLVANAKLLTRFIALAVAGLAAATVAACDSASGPAQAPDRGTRQVTVVGAGKVQGSPDTLTANVSMEAVAPDVTAAMNQASSRQQAVINALVNAGVDRKDISTSQVSLQPQYAQDGTAIVGYRASNSIDVKIRKLDSASQALTLIVSNGAVERGMDGSTFAKRLLDRGVARSVLNSTRPFRHAAALVFDRFGADEVAEARVGDRRVARLLEVVGLREEPDFSRRFPAERIARVRITLADGRVLVSEPTQARGGPDDALTDAELRDKYFALAVPTLGEARATRIDGLVQALPDAAALSPLLDSLLAPF